MTTVEVVLEQLRNKEVVSGEAMAKALNISRTAVWKAINSLRDLGYGIEGDPKGYRLVSTPDILFPDELKKVLRTKTMGKRIDHNFTIQSTNQKARELAEQEWPEGSLIIAEIQDAGKGRIGRSWSSPKGGIWMSLILRPEMRPSQSSVLTLAGGIAIVKALEKLGFKATLKWPNDVLIRERKVCGILTEMSGEMERVHYIVMGFGINANFKLEELPKKLHKATTTLLEERKRPVDRTKLVAEIMKSFEVLYKQNSSKIIEQWLGSSSTIGRRVRIETQTGSVTGTAKAVDDDGALVIGLGSGKEKTIFSGDCIHLRSTK